MNAITTLPILELDGDGLRLSAGQTRYVDVGRNASVSAGSPLQFLDFYLSSGGDDDRLGIDVNRDTSRVVLSDEMQFGSIVSIRMPDQSTVPIATIIEANDGLLSFGFDENVSNALIDALIHAVTYTSSAVEDGSVSLRDIIVQATRDGEATFLGVSVTIAAEGTRVLTAGIDSLSGSAGDDIIKAPAKGFTAGDTVDGGGGNDTLELLTDSSGSLFAISQLSRLTHVETIMGTAASDRIFIRGDQLTDVEVIDGNGGALDSLLIRGNTAADLVGKTLMNIGLIDLEEAGTKITVDSKAVANLVRGAFSVGDTLELVQSAGLITAAERLALHRQGIETITGYDADGIRRSTTMNGPAFVGLDGDRVYYDGTRSVRIDAGFDMALKADDILSVFSASVSSATSRLEIDTSGTVRLSGEAGPGTTITVGGIAIGTLSDVSGWYIGADFNDDATGARVQEFVRAIRFSDSTGSIADPQRIYLSLTDMGGRSEGAVVTVEPGQPLPQDPEQPTVNHAPGQLLLNAAAVAEGAGFGTLVGQLSAQDPDPNEALTYTLLDDAGGRFRIQGDRVVVGDGAAIDYERAASHTINVLVTDKSGESASAIFRIAVTDVAERVTLVGGAGIDTLLGGSLGDRLTGLGGADVLNGFGGDDILSGGAGRDILTGGPGHDTFVFDTRLARTNKAHKMAGLDRIADFTVADDTIQLSKAVFNKVGKGGILKTGMLAKGAFYLGSSAHDASDRVIYDRKSGALYYDKDGTGSHEAIQIATLSNNLKMSHANVFIL